MSGVNFLLDTNVIIGLLNRSPAARRLVADPEDVSSAYGYSAITSASCRPCYLRFLMRTIHAETVVSVDELKRDPASVLEQSESEPVAIFDHDQPTAYLISAL